MATGLSPEHKSVSDERSLDLLTQHNTLPTRSGRDHRENYFPGVGLGQRPGPTGSELATSWAAIPTSPLNGASPDPVDDSTSYPTAAEILEHLHTRVAILSGGRDRQGCSIITFPGQHKSFEYNRECVRKVVQYLACIPTEDVRESGFSVVVDARASNWQNIKLILRTLQEALPGQITVVFTLQPGPFWLKQQSTRGHNKERAKLEFSVETLSSPDKLIRYVESSQLTSDLGGFLPYNHELWIRLRLDLEHFISSFNALMEHTAHVEQQLVSDPDPGSVEGVEDCLARLAQMQEQLRKAPQNTIREGNELLRTLEQGREEGGTSGMTPDKINAQSIIRKLLDKITQRQMQLDSLWRERKQTLEQTLQLRMFDKSLIKLRFWLKSRGEEQLCSRCDVGTNPESVRALLELQEKLEAKTKQQHGLLTQLRRMADRFSGEQLNCAEDQQRQVAKLSSRFSRFEELLSERRSILESSLQLHNTMIKWRELCRDTAELLKLDTSDSVFPTNKLLGNHSDHMTQLWQVADTAMSEGTSLIEQMEATSQKLPSEGSKGAGPGYSVGVEHVERVMAEVVNQRARVGQLSEARRLQTEELKRLNDCERDTKQVIQWLQDMLTQQLLRCHGDMGDSLSAVNRLIIGHTKFSDNASKTYKYGCDLVTAAQKTRQSCRLDPQPSDTLLSTLSTMWSELSTTIDEVKGRLEMAREFHTLSEESLASYTEWHRPLHQLPKTPSLIEAKLKDITDNQGSLHEQLNTALDIGESLMDRLECPLTSDSDHIHPNEPLMRSLTFVRQKLVELREADAELGVSIPQQVRVLKDFLLYCQFESGIEKVLLWLQEHGLKRIHTFSIIKEGQKSVREQSENFEKFEVEVKAHSVKVEQIHREAGDIDTRIREFKSDLGKKAGSLKAVWDKFTARMRDRRTVISLATGFYGNVEKFRAQCEQLTVSVLSLTQEQLEQVKPKLDTLYTETFSQGEELLKRFQHSPGDQASAINKLSALMEDLKKQRNHVIDLCVSGKVKGQETVLWTNGVSRESPSLVATGDAKVSTRLTDMYGELEEEAYKHLEELENQCDAFLSSHTHLQDSPYGAKQLSSEYNDFLLTLNPLETKLEGVVSDLMSLCPQIPPLAGSIKQLCEGVRGRVAVRRGSVEQRSNVLRIYHQFCGLVKEVNSDLSTLDEFLCEPVDDSVAMVTLPKYKQLVEGLSDKYSQSRGQGEEFLKLTSEMLTTRVGPRLEVGGACTSVAFDLGDLEGRYPDIMERWAIREKELSQQMDWHSFKTNYDEISMWLKQSAGKFLETRIDVGTSLETAEDLLSELGEFEIRAKRTADEVDSLLAHSKVLLSKSVRESSELGDLAWDLRCLHDDFRQQLDSRGTSLKDAVSFFMTSEQLQSDMGTAMELCESLLKQDLPTRLKITSVSTRLVNLQYEGSKLLETLGLTPPTPDHAHKRERTRARRSESASASELAIKQLLATLQKNFNMYKKAVEQRVISSVGTDKETKNDKVTKVEERKNETKSSLAVDKKVEERKNGKKSPSDDVFLSVPHPRARANTVEDTKIKKKTSAVQQRVKMLNQQSSNDNAAALIDIGTSFTRSRANTADSTLSPSRRRSPLSSQRAESPQKPESPWQPDPPQSEVVVRSPTAGVPLRKKVGGVSRSERRDKINAIRRIFEATSADSANSTTEKSEAFEKTRPSLAVDQSEERVGPRQRLNTVPSVVKAVLKDSLVAKQQVITITMGSEQPVPINVQHPDTTDLPVASSPSQDTVPTSFSDLHSRLIRATRSASPQLTNHTSATPKSGLTSSDTSPIRRASKRPPPLRISGKVSSLRDMFDSHTKSHTLPRPQSRTSSNSGKSPDTDRGHKEITVVEHQSTLLEVEEEEGREYSPDIAPIEEGGGVDTMPHSPTKSPPLEEILEHNKPLPQKPTIVECGLEYEPHLLEHKPLPLTESTNEIVSTEELHPLDMPRPSSPVGRGLEEASDSSGSETSECELWSSEGGWSSDEVDGIEEPDSVVRIRKSVSAVLAELVADEPDYCHSLELLAMVYHPMFALRNVPTFLQGRGDAVLPNIGEIYNNHRQFSTALCRHGKTIEEVCQTFIDHTPTLRSYLPFLINTQRGLAILSEYGGSFFEDRQQTLEDDWSIVDHYHRVIQRMVEYDHLLRQLFTAAQKEALHSVGVAKEALSVVQKLLRDTDNLLILNSLRDCPHALTVDNMIRRDLFHSYVTRGKKKIREYHVILTPDHVIFTRPRGKGQKLYYEFTESLKIAEMHLLETYKTQEDTFALCEGNLSSDNLRVLTPIQSPLLMKTMWLQEIRPLLQKKHTRRMIIGDEDSPLPYCFHDDNMPRPLDHVIQATEEREKWVELLSLKRGKSFRSSVKRTGSLRQAKKYTEKPPSREKSKVNRSQSFNVHKREAFINTKEVGVVSPVSQDDTESRHSSTRQSQISSSSGGGVVNVQLASLSAGGQFLPTTDEELFIVTQQHSSNKEGFLSVEKGQLVEVLDNSRATWMVLTVARQPGELEMEGFLPSSCLRPATKEEVMTAHVSESQPLRSHDQSHDQFEAETGQEVSFHGTLEVPKPTTPTVVAGDECSGNHTPSQSTGQDTSNSITIVPRYHDDPQRESSSIRDVDSAQSSPLPTKRIKPPVLDLTNATPTLDHHPYDQMGPLYHDQGPHLSPMTERRQLWNYVKGAEHTSSIRSLPSTFSPVAPKSIQRFLGYNPMELPEVTLSYPELGPPAPPTEERRKAREELSKLRQATVKNRDDSVEEFDPVEVYVAIADFEAVEESSISLTAGQCVEVLDSTRSDWWLVYSTDSDREGWVPACYLGQYTLTDPSSPPPEPFEDVTGELAALMGESHDELNNIREDLVVEGSNSLATTTNAFEESKKTAVRSPSPQQPAPRLSLTTFGSPPSLPLWVVLADYKATESGMLSVEAGDLVEVLDISRNEWCLVHPQGRELEEGWVPMAYLKPYNNRSYASPLLLPPRFHQHLSSSDSDTPTEGSERSPVALSPEGLVEASSSEARTEARGRRRFVLSELASTEQDYVDKLQYCLDHYNTTTHEEGGLAPPTSQALSTLFGNLGDILAFHKDHFLPELQACEINPLKLGDLFVSCEPQLRLYVIYCRNKASSDAIFHDHAQYFEERRGQLRDRLKLPDYLIMPVQRITKYTLLLHDFHKYSVRAGLESGSILSALEVSRGISTLANNAIHLNMLDERVSRVELGELVMQEVFGSQEGQKQLYKERRIFLFEKALIITKRRHDNSDKDSYIVKEQLMLRDISMTQDMDPGRLNLITYDMLTGTKFILRAPKTSERDKWLHRANELIRAAKQNNPSFVRARTSSEPGGVQRTPTFHRRSLFKRDSTKRRSVSSRPQSASSVRSSVSPDEQEPPGTEYVVMECIVMEGGDDVTLEPGEVVKLVRAESGGVLRVRTVDDPPMEGKILASYLRKKDSVKGLKMEAIPKFTMRPSDMDLLAGTTATISCAFNGFPNPSIIWRKDHELLTEGMGSHKGEGSRWQITSCPTSSVLEVIKLSYEDEGAYSCYITNSMGSDSADLYLTVHGPPSQPGKPTASKITSSSVKLKWAEPEKDGKSMVHSYQVEMLQEGFEEWQPIIQHPRSHFMVKSLQPNTSYQFRVIAHNEYGASPPSESTKVILGARGRWQSFRRGNVSNLAVTSIDSTDGPFDELFPDEQNLSPLPQNIRRGSISNSYDVMADELGRGQYGIVHRCVHKVNGNQLAAKYIRLRSKRKASIRMEVELLRRVKGKSPNLLEFWDAFERGRNLIIVTELVPDGELIERIITGNDLTEAVAVGYISQLLCAVETLHSQNIAHLDIRPENLLLSGDTLKLIDFGSAKDMTSELSPLYTSSVEFAAPEILNQELPSLSADLWSVGVVTYTLLSGISPFFADNIQATVERIKEARYSFYHNQFEQISQEAKDFISALLQKCPQYRLTSSTARDHSWIRTLVQLKSKDRATSPWPMARLDITALKAFNARRKWMTMSVAIDDTTVFGSRSTICLSPAPPDFEKMAKNESPPHLWDGPTRLQAQVGSKVNISYSFAGNPEPMVIWEHEEVEITPSHHHNITTSGGVTTLSVMSVRREDKGVYSCSALNGSGSASQECHLTIVDCPGPPLEVTAVLLGGNTVMVSWLPPVDTGGCSITSYIIHRKQLLEQVWEEAITVSDITAHVVEDLSPRASHVFRVSAVNEVGVGSHSEITPPVTVSEAETITESGEARLKMSSMDDEYESGKEIWRGNYTVVVQCRAKSTDRLYAAKLLTVTSPQLKERALLEFDMLHCLSHPRVAGLEMAFLSETQLSLVMEYVSGGTLEHLLSAEHMLTEPIASRYTRQIAEGLGYLHDSKIILVNLSPDNLLLAGGHKELKICDFSLSRYIESGNQLTALEGRVEFMAPEAVALQPLTTAADIWSLGTIVYLMLTGTSPFLDSSQDTTVSKVTSCHLDINVSSYSTLSSDARDFIQYRVIVRNPRRRLTAAQCQRHNWLQTRNTQSPVDQTLSGRGTHHPSDRGQSMASSMHSTISRLTSKRSSLT